MEQQLKELALDFFNVGAIKFGEFVTKVGLITPIYVDLRVLIAHPKIMVSFFQNFNRKIIFTLKLYHAKNLLIRQ